MPLKPVTNHIDAFLQSCTIIDWHHPSVLELARRLSAHLDSDKTIAHSCFEWVRDEIRHSWDYRQGPVTCAASEVLRYRTGYCYAKAHLLAALLRANGIPAGLCYQRLSLEGDGAPYCLHGLNAVYLSNHGWYRIDPRGNKEGVDAQFKPPTEKLAFALTTDFERDSEDVFVRPIPVVVEALTTNATIEDVYRNLPDCE